MEKLHLYGWSKYHPKTPRLESPDLNETGRVISLKGHEYEVVSNKGIFTAELLGKLLVAFDKEEQPKVGDWVRFIRYDDSNSFISDVLPRMNLLYRKAIGKEGTRQVMAANLEFAVVIQGLDQDFNLNRLERYLVQIASCGIKPVVILNKSDLVEKPNDFVERVRKLEREIPVFTCSTKTGEGIVPLLEKVFKPLTTSVLIGSSGVGKSSLLNALQESQSRAVGEISESTRKGKHTTTTRDLFLLENGGIIIDTPGMREFGVGYEEEGDFSEQFPIIDRYASGCRYNDCTHTGEQGCAVFAAYEASEFEPLIYENYLKLIKEQRRFQTSLYEKKREGKRFGKMAREAQNMKKRFKG